MSKLSFDPEDTRIFKCRKLSIEDAEEAVKLITPEIIAFLGTRNVARIIKKCFISVCAVSSKNEIVGFLCLHDHPGIPYLLPSEWEPWLKKITHFKNATCQNSLWIQYLGFHPGYALFCLRPIFEHLYHLYPHLKHILMPSSPVLIIPDVLKEHFDSVICVDQYPNFEHKILINMRHSYVVKYKIRRAVEEDNDSIVNLIDSHSKRLRELYGDFYISEIITGLIPCSRQLVVAEHMQKVVAVLILNDVVNYARINKCFELNTYNKLYKTNEDNVPNTGDIKSTSSSTSSFNSKTYGLISSTEDFSNNFSDISSELLQDTKTEEANIDSNISTSDLLTLDNVFPENVGFFDKPRSSACLLVLHRLNTETVAFQIPDEAESLSISTELNKSSKEEKTQEENSSFGNAFALEIYASEEMHEKSVLPDILEAAFQCFPNKDYCIFTIPSEEPHSPLFNLFVRVVPKADSVYPQELCILHRNALKTEISVRQMQSEDYEIVKKLVTELNKSDPVYFILRQFIQKKAFNNIVYVVLNYGNIIGFVVIHPADMINYFWENFQLESYIDKEDYKYRTCGIIEYFHIMTIYYKQIQFILRELHRLTDMPIFFYKLKCIDLSTHTRRKPLPIILNSFFPVTPRRDALSKINTDSKQLEYEENFALYIYSSRVCSFDRIAINSRLVIVGASTAGLSFISTLIYSFDNVRHLVFNNITLVHDQNINEEITCDIANDMFMYNGYSSSRLFYIYLCTSISIVKGKMTAIDRTNKYITINGTEILPYDLLFLMTGAQNHGSALPRNGGELPINVFIINQPKNAAYSLQMLQSLVKKKKQPDKKQNVIVYGHTLSAYCCLGVLQRLQIPNLQIIFVHPIPEDDLNYETELFNNPELQEAVKTIIKQNNIILYKGYSFKEWTIKSKINVVKSVTIQTKQDLLTLDCIAFFYYEEETVDYETYLAIFKAGLVYDGKLVIQCNCSVNDPYIFACGPMTKYSRRYYADNFTHLYYNSAEIGARLAVQVRSSLIKDELKEDESEFFCRAYEELEKQHLIVPQYTQPVTKSFKLPGGYTYFNIETPGKRIPIEIGMNSISFGRILQTGNLNNISHDQDPLYFLLKLNPHGVIKQITCLTKRPLCVSVLEKIWGKHESLFNNLTLRYDSGLIDDFYSYFEQPSLSAFFFNKFDLYQDAMFRKLKIFATKVLEEEQQKRGDKCPMDLDEKISVIKQKFVEHNYADFITQEVVEFIEEHTEYLPMYAHDIITRYELDNDTIL